MASVEKITCPECGVVVMGKLALYQHNKKLHPELVQKKDEVKEIGKETVPAEVTVTVPRKQSKLIDDIKAEGIELLKTYCRSSLNDIEHKRTFDKICEQEFIQMYIPPGIGEKEGAQMEFGTNGCMFVVPKSVRVILPRSFAEEVFAQNGIKGFDAYKITTESPMGKQITSRV